MQLFLSVLLLISSSLFSQELFVQEEEKNLYRSAVEYSFDEVLDNGSYTFLFEQINGMINIIGHAGSGTHLIIDNRVHAFSNKNAISILKNSQINVYHDKIEKVIRIKKMSERYDHKIIGKIDLHLPFNTNLRGTIKNSDLTIAKVRGTIAINTESTDSDLNNLNGNINITTRGGNISATKLSGEMELTVVSGDINIFDCDANSMLTMDNGNIFINGLKGNLLSNTTLGETLVSNYEGESSVFNINVGNLKINKSKSNINATIDIGSVNINNIQGATTIFTGKGEINLNNIIGDVNCNTNFGNVNGINLFGKINANSELGDIEINKGYNSFLKDHSVNIATKRGSISVRLPSDLPYTIKSQCHNLETRNAISSEIPLDEEFLSAKVVGQGKIKEGTISCNLSSNYGPISIFTN
jgi:hypothetical protein